MAVCPRTTVKVVLVRPLLEVVALPGWGVVVVAPQLGSCCCWAFAQQEKKVLFVYKKEKQAGLSGMANGDLKVLSPVGLGG